MNIEHVVGIAGLLVMVVACASPAEEGSKTSEAAITDADGQIFTLEVDDLDGDGVKETWYTRPELCGVGGQCTYSIHLSRWPDETFGEVWGTDFRAKWDRLNASDPPLTFLAETRSGVCNASIEHFAFNEEARVFQRVHTVDCNEVIHRPDGRFADGEYACFRMTPINLCNQEK